MTTRAVEHDRNHPDIHSPFAAFSEEETLHVVLVYNNPFRWESRRRLFNDCVRHMLSCPNVRVYPIELAYDQRPFEVTDPQQADFVNSGRRVDTQLRSDCAMWHKENLINLAVRRFPPGWRYGGYWDADFTTTRHDWALETIHMLQHYSWVQLFSTYVDLTGNYPTSWMGQRPYRMSSSFAYNFLHQGEFKTYMEKAGKFGGMGNTYGIRLDRGPKFPYGLPPGATGGGWAWRRQAFTTVGGLLETCILGSGDWHMAFGLSGLTNVAAEMKRCTEPYVNKVLQWQQRAGILQSNPGKGVVGCIDHHAIHHFHGSKTRRQYGDRWAILRDNQFDPDVDITKDWQGVFRFTGNKPALRDAVTCYFVTRVEDDPGLRGNERELL